MTIVLGIDAAWTATEPSGVALVREVNGIRTCLAVTPSYQSFLDLALGRPVDWHSRANGAGQADVPRLIKAAEAIAGTAVDVVAVDMPISREPLVTRRVADNKVSIEFGARWCSAHSPTPERPGTLGLALSTAFEKAGYPIAVAGEEQRTRCQLEVYPHTALLSLLKAEMRVPYKVSKSKRYWPTLSVQERIRALVAQFEIINSALQREFGQTGVPIPEHTVVQQLSVLKRYEDSIDALICGWVGLEYLAGRTVALGDHAAAVWCPKNVLLNAVGEQ